MQHGGSQRVFRLSGPRPEGRENFLALARTICLPAPYSLLAVTDRRIRKSRAKGRLFGFGWTRLVGLKQRVIRQGVTRGDRPSRDSSSSLRFAFPIHASAGIVRAECAGDAAQTLGRAEEAASMATVDCDRDCRDDFDDFDGSFGDPAAVADSDYSDASRAADEAAGVNRSKEVVLHRIAEVRQRQRVTLRNVARRLGLPLPLVRRQEQADCDLRLSDLLRWQEVLEVPIAELLVEGDGQLSGPVLERSRMVKLMKTAAAIKERSGEPSIQRLCGMLVDQILEIMPELADVSPWHSVGQRRTRDELGRAARMIVSEDTFRTR